MFYANLYTLLALSSVTLLIYVWSARPIAVPRWVKARIDANPKQSQR